MTDAELVEKKLAFIESCLSDLARLACIEMAGFRNLVVHAYVSVDMELVGQVVRNDLGELQAFVGSIRARLSAP
jgi:uncharacterized protein YutE (UPF0331/DUF86 family)